MQNSAEYRGEQPPDSEKNKELAPEGSLAKVREQFGTLLVDTARSVFQKDYRGHGDRILINTTAEGIRGPKTGRSSSNGKEGSAFIDMALSPEAAQWVYEELGQAIEDWKESQQE